MSQLASERRACRLLWAALLTLLSGLLPACDEDAGTPCRKDHHCYSNSCTLGTCDSRFGKALAESIFGDEDEEKAAPEPRCEGLEPEDCTEPHCMLKSTCATVGSCDQFLKDGYDCPFCKVYGCGPPCREILLCVTRR